MEVKEFELQIREAFGKYDISGREFLNDILLLKRKERGKELTGDFLNDLYNNYSLEGRTIGVDFNSELIENSDFIFFASQDPFNIGVQKATEEIIMWDRELEEIHHVIAPNLGAFLKVILMIYDYSLAGWIEEKKYTKEDRNALFVNIEKQLEAPYLDYYRESFSN